MTINSTAEFVHLSDFVNDESLVGPGGGESTGESVDVTFMVSDHPHFKISLWNRREENSTAFRTSG